MASRDFVTRFAPSPTGPLHLGHAFSALLAHDMARDNGGTFLLRIEDIDATRCRPEWEDAIFEDLAWLGITWDGVIRQSERSQSYIKALEQLWQMGLLYECTCNRRDIRAALSAPQEGAPMVGPDGLVYPGTCRNKPRPQVFPKGAVLRLDMQAACQRLEDQAPLTFLEIDHLDFIHSPVSVAPDKLVSEVGDVLLSRKDFLGSYHLSVVLDDAAQAITHVIRGQDLFEASFIHRVIQGLLGLDTPVYLHHRLIRDAEGKRLAKRDNARAIRTLRDEGATPQDIRALVGI